MIQDHVLTPSDVALKPLLQLIKDCDASNISTIRTLVLKVLTHPEVFAGFDETKLAVKDALASAADGEVLLRTLDLFSYGTYRDYVANTNQYVSLTESQLRKLKMLSVISLVQQSCCSADLGVVSYGAVAHELGIAAEDADALRQVEELIIGSIYAGVVNGKLCQKTKTLTVSAESGPPYLARDVPLSQVSSLLETLRGLQQNLDVAMSSMDVEKKDVEGHRKAVQDFWQETTKKATSKSSEDKKTAPIAFTGGWPTSSNSSRLQDRNRAAPSSSSTTRRQAKRSRGGFGGLVETFGRF